MSAFLQFDQMNIQRALANGNSLDNITTSGTGTNNDYWALNICEASVIKHLEQM